jgi:hypothetical protein
LLFISFDRFSVPGCRRTCRQPHHCDGGFFYLRFVMTELVLGIDFCRALVDYYGLPPDQIDADVRINASRDDIFGATLTIMMTADDLAAIAQRMPGAMKLYRQREQDEIARLNADYETVRRQLERATSVDIGFDGWMRQRTDRAHAEFMARTSRHINLQEAPCAN